MTAERRPRDIFHITEKEDLYYRITDARFRQLLDDPATTAHRVHFDHNSFGEYLFVTLSQVVDDKRYAMTFYGLGYHEQREQWIKDVWVWYENHSIDSLYRQSIPKEQALAQIEARRQELATEPADTTPSERAILYALLADLTDEDGAYSELEDLEASGLLWADEEGGEYPF